MSQAAGEETLAVPGTVPTVLDPADGWVVAGVAVTAVATDLALRSGALGLAGALLVLVAAVALLACGRLATWQARLVAAVAPVFGAFLAIRTSAWLLPLDLLAALGLLALGASLARGGDVLDLTVPRVVMRAVHAVLHAMAAPAFAAAPARRAARRHLGEAGRAEAVLRVVGGVLLAVPLLLLLGFLLASADAVFASFFRVDVDLASLAGHAAALAVGAWGAASLLRVTSVVPVGPLGPGRRMLGSIEAMIVLAGLAVLFAVFAATQVVALSKGGRHVLATAGLTYAEYARSGFFQLLAVAVITLGVLLALRALTDLEHPGRRRAFAVLAEVAVALTLVVVVVAIRRLDLYERTFGLTMLRLYSELFSYWVGVVFLLLGCSLAGLGSRRAWFLGAAAAVGLALLLALNVVNPEAVVVRHNLARAPAAEAGSLDPAGRFDTAERLDQAYLAGLSDDAVPTLVDRVPSLDPAARAAVTARLCQERPAPRWTGWPAWNLGHARARQRLAAFCP